MYQPTRGQRNHPFYGSAPKTRTLTTALKLFLVKFLEFFGSDALKTINKGFLYNRSCQMRLEMKHNNFIKIETILSLHKG